MSENEILKLEEMAKKANSEKFYALKMSYTSIYNKIKQHITEEEYVQELKKIIGE